MVTKTLTPILALALALALIVTMIWMI